MKSSGSREVGLVVAGILIGFATGIYTFQAFFILPGGARNGMATFIASGSGLLGSVMMVLIRAEARRSSVAGEKHGA